MIWKVQTLSARDLKQGDQPGNVLVVVVPGPDSTQVLDPITPRASRDLLQQIQTYLRGLVSPFVKLHVVNPHYVHIEVVTTVRFSDGDDHGADIERLNNELVQYLAPWFYDNARAAKGGYYVSEADISEFIQTRPYVNAMISLAFIYKPKRKTYDWYFLTSAQKHQIKDADTNYGSRTNL